MLVDSSSGMRIDATHALPSGGTRAGRPERHDRNAVPLNAEANPLSPVKCATKNGTPRRWQAAAIRRSAP
jgi:hypothetical protein